MKGNCSGIMITTSRHRSIFMMQSSLSVTSDSHSSIIIHRCCTFWRTGAEVLCSKAPQQQLKTMRAFLIHFTGLSAAEPRPAASPPTPANMSVWSIGDLPNKEAQTASRNHSLILFDIYDIYVTFIAKLLLFLTNTPSNLRPPSSEAALITDAKLRSGI